MRKTTWEIFKKTTLHRINVQNTEAADVNGQNTGQQQTGGQQENNGQQNAGQQQNTEQQTDPYSSRTGNSLTITLSF